MGRKTTSVWVNPLTPTLEANVVTCPKGLMQDIVFGKLFMKW